MLKSFAKDTAVYGGINFFASLISFACSILFVRFLGVSDFGLMALIMGLIAIISGILHFGLANAMQRFYFNGDDNKNTIVHSTLTLSAIINGLSVLGILIFLVMIRGFLPVEWRVEVTCFSYGLIAVPFLALGALCVELQRLRFNLPIYALTKVCLIVATPCMPIAFLLIFDQGLMSVFQGAAFGAFMAFACLCFLMRKDFLPFLPNKNMMRQLFIFGYPFIFASLSITLFNTIDKWMIAYFHSKYDVGIYTAGETISKITLFLSMAISMSWSPYALRLYEQDKEHYKEKIITIFNAAFTVMALFALIIVIYSREIIMVVMPVEYLSAALSSSILTVGVVVLFFHQIAALGISLEKRTGLISKGWVITLTFNVVLNIMAIPILGQAGAAISTALCYMVTSGFFIYHSQRLHYFPLPLKSYILILLLLVGMCGYVQIIHTYFIGDSLWMVLAMKTVGLIVGFSIILCHELIPRAYFHEAFRLIKIMRPKNNA